MQHHQSAQQYDHWDPEVNIPQHFNRKTRQSSRDGVISHVRASADREECPNDVANEAGGCVDTLGPFRRQGASI
jgi:hypothetical protein